MIWVQVGPSGRIVAIFGGPRVGYPLHSQEPLELVGCSHTIGFLKYKHQHFIRCLPACFFKGKGLLAPETFLLKLLQIVCPLNQTSYKLEREFMEPSATLEMKEVRELNTNPKSSSSSFEPKKQDAWKQSGGLRMSLFLLLPPIRLH